MPYKIAVIMGSDNDISIMCEASVVLKEFGIEVVQRVVSAHRTPHKMYQFAVDAEVNCYDIIIAGAGGAAHLPGMVASLTPIPVIGVPICNHNTSMMYGLDSVLSILQMPAGVPVATVGINNAHNAALLAIKMLAIRDKDLQEKLKEWENS